MTDFRALCAELMDAIDSGIPVERMKQSPLAVRVDAALAQQHVSQLYKLPEPVAPTDEDLEDLAEVMNVSGNPVPAMRRALELWGNSQGILDSSPQAEPVEPTDEEIEEWADASSEVPLEEMDPEVHGWRRCFTKKEFGASIRAALARWGTPANNTREENFDA